jgi:DNA-binding NarL/FixJ family response regulator
LGKHVLLAVDDLLVQTNIIEGAKALGITCDRARTADDALRHAAAKPPAVVFLDLSSKRFHPFKLLRALRDAAHPAHACRIVGFVSHDNAEMRVRAHERGCDFVYPRSALAKQAASILRQLVGTD